MLRSLRIVSLALVLLPLCGCVSNMVTAREDYQFESPWNSYARVDVRSTNGRLQLTKSGRANVLIHGSKQASGMTLDDAKSLLGKLNVVAEPDAKDPTTLVVRLEAPTDLIGRNIGASILIEVPSAIAAKLSTTNGSITAAGMKEVGADSCNGRVNLSDIDGAAQADTSNGGVQLERIAGAARASTSNGSIVVRDAKGGLHAETSNGAIDATAIVGSAELTSSNGRIDLDAAPAADSTISLISSNGAIRATLTAEIRGTISLSTSNGSLNTELGKMQITSERRGKHDMEATINGGGSGRIIARTSNGALTIIVK